MKWKMKFNSISDRHIDKRIVIIITFSSIGVRGLWRAPQAHPLVLGKHKVCCGCGRHYTWCGWHFAWCNHHFAWYGQYFERCAWHFACPTPFFGLFKGKNALVFKIDLVAKKFIITFDNYHIFIIFLTLPLIRICSFNLLTQCTLIVRWMYIECKLIVHWLYIECRMYVECS